MSSKLIDGYRDAVAESSTNHRRRVETGSDIHAISFDRSPTYALGYVLGILDWRDNKVNEREVLRIFSKIRQGE